MAETRGFREVERVCEGFDRPRCGHLAAGLPLVTCVLVSDDGVHVGAVLAYQPLVVDGYLAVLFDVSADCPRHIRATRNARSIFNKRLCVAWLPMVTCR